MWQYTSQFPNNQFIFDSVSPAALNADPYNKLNDSVDRLNKLLVQLSFWSSKFKLFKNIYNLGFLIKHGTYCTLMTLKNCFIRVLGTRNSCHIRFFFTGSLPLRRPYNDLYHDYMNTEQLCLSTVKIGK